MVVTAASAEAGDAAEPVAQTMRQALSALFPDEPDARQMAKRFREQLSTAPRPITDEDRKRLDDCAEAMLLEAAFGRFTRAKNAFQRCRAFIEPRLVSLNREDALAKKVFDTCLFMVRTYTELRSNRRMRMEQARALVMQCRSMVPDITPDIRLHPPPTVSLLASVERDVKAVANVLEVRDSQGRGCATYINGRRLGTTPFTWTGLAPGQYRVQVECNDEPGRIHLASVGDGPARITVDEAFDRILHSTAQTVQLRYNTQLEHDENRIADARAIGRALRVGDVWLVTGVGGGQYRIDRILTDAAEETPCQARASVLVAWNRAHNTLRHQAGVAAADRLRRGLSVNLARARESPFRAHTSSACLRARLPAASLAKQTAAAARPPSSQGGDETLQIVATTGFIVGATTLLTGGSLLLASMPIAAQIPSYTPVEWLPSRVQQVERDRRVVDDLETASVTTTIVGAVITAGTLPFVLPEEDDFPLWTLIPGIAGLGAAVGGTILVAMHGQRTDDFLPSVWGTEPRGAVLLALSAVMLEVPLVYLARMLFGPPSPEAEAEAEADPEPTLSLQLQPSPTQTTVGLRGLW